MVDLLLPPGTTLLHVGPHKTGTTALQNALHHVRPELVNHGVVYPGRLRQHGRAALALTGHRPLRGYPQPARVEWDALVSQVGRVTSDQRVMVSSEFFGEADADVAGEVVEGLGAERVHVLVTLRPLTKIMPSAWQQYVRNGLAVPYDSWLEGMLSRPPYDRPTPSFWRRHHHDQLVERWASVVGPQNLTVLVVDENDRDLLTQSVEAMLGLPVGMLKPAPGRSNRSLTWAEIELVRQLNLEFHARGWTDELYRAYVFPMAQHLQDSYRPGPDEPRITTPGWALDRAAEIGAAAAEVISGLDVRVIGDLRSLGQPPNQPAGDPAATAAAAGVVPAAVAAVVGTVLAGVRQEDRIRREARTAVQRAPSGELMNVVMTRLARRSRITGPHRVLRKRRVQGQ